MIRARRCTWGFHDALDALAKVGASVEDVVRTRMYVVNGVDADAVGRAHGEIFGEVRPSPTMVMVAVLINVEHLGEVEQRPARLPKVTASLPVGPGRRGRHNFTGLVG